MTGQIEAEIITVNDMVVAGPRGLSAYELAVLNGYSGTEQEWLASLKGDEGEQGPQGEDGEQGIQGETGNGIASITKSATSGLTDTYTVTYTSGNTTTFFVTNGKGISTISKVSTSGLADTYRVTFNDNTYFEYTVTNGANAKINGLDTLNISAGTNISIEQNGSTLIISADSYDDSEIKNDIEDIKSEQNTQKLNIQTNKIDISSLRSTKANVSDLSQVATTGAYGDLSGKPVIGTGLLTLQKNSEDIGTFGANSTSSKTINIEIPTKTSDINNNSGFIDKNVNNLTNYTKTSEMNVLLSYKANSSDVYSKTDVYNKTETDTLLNTKQNTLTFDTTPTENSTNPVTSGGIYDSQEEQDTNIELLQNLVNQMPTVEATGTDISLVDVLNYRLMKFLPQGVSSQESTTGKNLLPITNQDFTINGIRFQIINGKLKVSGTASADITGFIMRDNNCFPIMLEAGTYYLSRNLTNTTIGLLKQTGGTTVASLTSTSSAKSVSFTLTETTQLYFFFYIPNGTTKDDTFEIMISTNDGDWEPYTGGIPAPNSSYPYPVKTVTGDNILVISNSDNSESQTYPISLGNIELCKIGDYQDYIYKNGDNWYKKEMINKIHYMVTGGSSGSAGGTFAGMQTNGYICRYFDLSRAVAGNTNRSLILCNRFKGTNNGLWNGASGEGIQTGVAETGTPIYMAIKYSTLENYYGEPLTSSNYKTAWVNYFTNNPTYIYYRLVEPADIPITDTTLISQLNDIYENAKSYNGTTNVTSTYASGNEQMIIDASALSDIFKQIQSNTNAILEIGGE